MPERGKVTIVIPEGIASVLKRNVRLCMEGSTVDD